MLEHVCENHIYNLNYVSGTTVSTNANFHLAFLWLPTSLFLEPFYLVALNKKERIVYFTTVCKKPSM